MNSSSVQLARRRRSQARWSASRGLIAEQLEDRRLLSGVEAPYHNTLAPLDVSRDWAISPLDALLVINALNAGGARELDPSAALAVNSPRVDTDGDNLLTPIDALRVINALNRGEGLNGDVVAFRLELQDVNGVPIAPLKDSQGHLILDGDNDPIYPINVGQEFRVQIYSQDLRATAPKDKFGVYEATLDVAYSDPALFSMGSSGLKPEAVSPREPDFESFFTPGSFYYGNEEGSFNVYRAITDNVDGDNVPNEFDELQVLAEKQSSHGRGAVPLVYVSLRADSVGKLTFSLNQSDRPSPWNHILVLGDDLPVPPDQVDFGVPLHVTIVQPVNAVDDAFPIAPNVILEDGGPVMLNVLANDFLQIGSTGTLALAATLPVLPAHGTATVVGNQIRYQPAPDFFGTDTFVYRAVDGLGNSDTATVTVTVTSVNDPPVAVADTATVLEDSVANVIDVLANDSAGPANEDPALTIDPASLTQPAHGSVTLINGNTQVQYTPVANYFGSDSFAYRAKDSDGATSNLVTVTITVTNVNDPPTVADDAATVLEDSSSNIIKVLANDKPGPVGVGDESGVDSLTIISVQGFDHGGSASIVGDVLHYTPAPDFFGVETFTYTVRDSGGLTATATVTVTVTNVNDPVEAVDDEVFVDEFTENNQLDVLANDRPGPDNEIPIDNLLVTAVGTPSAGGSVAIAPDGKSVLYTPDGTKFGPYEETFTYTMSDGQYSDTATVLVHVEPVIRPRARDDKYTVLEDSANNVLTVTLNDLFNDGATRALTQILVAPAHGVAVIDGLNILYTPTANYFGTDTLVYEIDDDFVDGEGQPSAPSTATVTITVTNVNDAPTVADDTATVLEDSLNNVIDVLANDLPGPVGVGDESGVDSLTIVSVQGFSHGGSATIVGNTVRYTPAPDFFGVETFTYTVRDTGGLEAVGTVTVTVENVNDPPTANPDSAIVDEDSVGNAIDVLANDTIEPDEGETLSIVHVGANAAGDDGKTAQGGTVTISGDKVLYTPKPDFFGIDTFTYTISDGNGGTAKATVTVQVNDVNDDPTANDDLVMALKNFTNQELDVLANDTIEPDVNEVLTIIGLGPLNESTIDTPHGTASISADGTKIIYTPDPDFETVGADYDVFTYTISDGRGGTSTATVQVDVVDAVPSNISGVVYLDVNNNGVRDPQEIVLAGVEVTLTGTNIRGVPVNRTVKTDVHGVFLFENILPNAAGDTVGYTISSATERFLIDGIDSIVDSTVADDLNPGTAGNDVFTGISLGLWGTQRSEMNYLFGERGLQSKYISIAQFLSSTRTGLAVATNLQGDDFWFALLQGWEGVASVDVQLAADLATCQLTIVDIHGHSQTRTIGYQKYHVAGDRATGDFMVYFNGSAADLGFDLLASNGGDAGEGESVEMYDAEYADGADVVFAEGAWA